MPTAPRPHTTPEEYLAGERRAETKSEFFRNEVFAMAGASPRHVQMSGNIARAIGNQLVGRDCIVYVADLRAEITATDSYAYPDVVVVCGGPMLSARDEYTITNPRLIVEVLSPATADYDRSGKFEHHRAIESFREYLCVDQDRVHVEHWIRQRDGSWNLSESNNIDDTIALDSLGLHLSLTAVYENVQIAGAR